MKKLIRLARLKGYKGFISENYKAHDKQSWLLELTLLAEWLRMYEIFCEAHVFYNSNGKIRYESNTFTNKSEQDDADYLPENTFKEYNKALEYAIFDGLTVLENI